MRTYQMNAYMNDETEDQWFSELFLKHCGDTRSHRLYNAQESQLTSCEPMK